MNQASARWMVSYQDGAGRVDRSARSSSLLVWKEQLIHDREFCYSGKDHFLLLSVLTHQDLL